MIFAIVLPVMVGAMALAVDAGVWMVQKRSAQGAADQAAYSAAVAGAAGASTSQGTTEAKAVTASMGFVDGVDGVTIAVNHPPTGYTGNYWEVIVRQPQMAAASMMFMSNAPTAAARAVAGNTIGGNTCVVALSSSASPGVRFANNSNFTQSGCTIYSNSTAAASLTCNNNCTIAASTYVVGGVSTQPNSHLNGAVNKTGTTPAADPYASVSVTEPGTCTGSSTAVTSGSWGGGRYCHGFNIPNNGSVTLTGGVYYVDNKFTFGNGATLNATAGVTIIIRPNPAGTDFALMLGTGVTLNITAQSTGSFAGIAIMGLSAAAAKRPVFNNNDALHITGALYFPNQLISMDNNIIFDATKCTQIVGNTVQMSNNVTTNYNCPGSGIRDFGGTSSVVNLIE
jgi:Flp pilus assembly protein TadG